MTEKKGRRVKYHIWSMRESFLSASNARQSCHTLLSIATVLLWTLPLQLLEILRNDDGDGDGDENENENENVTKQYVLISSTMALQVRYIFWYISLRFSAKPQREIIKSKVLWRKWTHGGEFFSLYLNVNALNAIPTNSAPRGFGYIISKIEQVEIIAK